MATAARPDPRPGRWVRGLAGAYWFSAGIMMACSSLAILEEKILFQLVGASLVLLALSGTGLLLAADPAGWKRFPWLGLAVSALFLAWMGVSWAASDFPMVDRNIPLTLLVGTGLFWLTYRVRLADGASRWPLLVLSYVAGLGALQAVVGLLQMTPLWLNWFKQTPDYEARVYGILRNPNQFASFMAFTLPLLAAAVAGPGFRWWMRLGAGLLAVTGVIALLASLSRGAVVSAVAGFFLALALVGTVRRRWIPAGIGLGFALILLGCLAVVTVRFYRDYLDFAVAPPALTQLQAIFAGNIGLSPLAFPYYDPSGDGELDSRDLVLAAENRYRWARLRDEMLFTRESIVKTLAQRFTTVFTAFTQDDTTRFLLVLSAARMWKDHPVWGVGPGNYARYSPLYLIDPPTYTKLPHAHCLPLHLLVELGLPGLAAWLLVVAGLLAALARLAARHWAWAFFAGWSLLGLTVHNLIDITWWYHPLKYVVPVVLAIVMTEAGRRDGFREP